MKNIPGHRLTQEYIYVPAQTYLTKWRSSDSPNAGLSGDRVLGLYGQWAPSVRKGTGSPKGGRGWIPTANPFSAF